MLGVLRRLGVLRLDVLRLGVLRLGVRLDVLRRLRILRRLGILTLYILWLGVDGLSDQPVYTVDGLSDRRCTPVDGLNHRWCTPVDGLGNCMSTVLQWLADRHVRHFACGTCDIHSRGEPPRGRSRGRDSEDLGLFLVTVWIISYFF